MSTPIPTKTPTELRAMTSGALIIRAMECARRLERMPHAKWLQDRYHQAADELMERKAVGTLSAGLCGIWEHHLRLSGGITPCSCHSD